MRKADEIIFLEEGKIKSIYESVQNLQESLSLTLEQALAALKVSESEWESYISYLNKDN